MARNFQLLLSAGAAISGLLLPLQPVLTRVASAGEITLNGKNYPDLVNLAYELSPYTQDKQIGGTCHIETAATLAEAACYRRTSPQRNNVYYIGGKQLRFSRAHLFYQHIFTEIRASKLIVKPQWGGIDDLTGSDQGWPNTSLRRISTGSTLLDPERALDEQLYGFMRSFNYQQHLLLEEQLKTVGTQYPPDYVAPPAVAALYEQRFNPGYTFRWKEQVSAQVSAFAPNRSKPDADGMVVARNTDADLYDCLSRGGTLEGQYQKFTPEAALDLLSRHIPFGCDFKNFKFDPEDNFSGKHVITVIGYQFKPGAIHNLEFFVRDSARPETITMQIADCDLTGMLVVR